MEKRKKWEELTNAERQEKTANIVGQEVYINQGMLVQQLLGAGMLEWEDIRNFWAEDGGQGEIFEWWAVSSWLAKKLDAKGEPLLYGWTTVWWGRQCTGQAIKLDGVFQDITQELYEL